jgi:hypothetical protein
VELLAFVALALGAVAGYAGTGPVGAAIGAGIGYLLGSMIAGVILEQVKGQGVC